MEPEIFAVDPYIIAFIKYNWLSITLFISLLKGLAMLTPSTTDDKIATLIGNLFNTIKPKNKSPVKNVNNV